MKKLRLYHYSRAIKSELEAQGLLLKSTSEWRELFIERFSHLAPEGVMDYFERVWSSEDIDSAEPSLWFVENRQLDVSSCSIKYLIGMYGGEVISMCTDLDDEPGRFLQSIGSPVEVVVEVSANDHRLRKLGNGEYQFFGNIPPCEVIKINELPDRT